MIIIETRRGIVHYAGLQLSVTPFVTVLNAVLPADWGQYPVLKDGTLQCPGKDPVPVDEKALLDALNVSPPVIAAVKDAARDRLLYYKEGRLDEGVAIAGTVFGATGEAARRLSALSAKAAVDVAAGNGERNYAVTTTNGTASIRADQVAAILDQVAEYGLTQEAAAVTALNQVDGASTVAQVEAAIAAYLTE